MAARCAPPKAPPTWGSCQGQPKVPFRGDEQGMITCDGVGGVSPGEGGGERRSACHLPVPLASGPAIRLETRVSR